MFVGALALAVVATMVYGMARWTGSVHAAPTSSPTGETICVVNNSTQCLDLQGDQFVQDHPIVFYGIDTSEERFRWNLALTPEANVTYDAQTGQGSPFVHGSFDQYYQGDPIFYIEKSTLTGHNGCIGTETGYQWNLAWEPCTTNNTTVWVQHNQYFVNVHWTNSDPINPQKWLMSEEPGQNSCQDGDGFHAQLHPQSDTPNCNRQFNYGLYG
jgi:hypothetical protein